MTQAGGLRTARTAEVGADQLAAIRALLQQVFGPTFTADDWDHCLGGMHAYIGAGEELVAHAAVGQRRLLNAGRAWRVGYVEGVAVRGDHRRRGYGSALLQACETEIRNGFAFGALGATEDGKALYEARGWQAWPGTLGALTPDGVRQTPDEEGGVYVWDPQGLLDPTSALLADFREGDIW